jgi:hypothetical protein
MGMTTSVMASVPDIGIKEPFWLSDCASRRNISWKNGAD